METTTPLSQDVWERTPAAAQASIRALEARVVALATTMQRLLERLRMDAPNTSQPSNGGRPQPQQQLAGGWRSARLTSMSGTSGTSSANSFGTGMGVTSNLNGTVARY